MKNNSKEERKKYISAQNVRIFKIRERFVATGLVPAEKKKEQIKIAYEVDDIAKCLVKNNKKDKKARENVKGKNNEKVKKAKKIALAGCLVIPLVICPLGLKSCVANDQPIQEEKPPIVEEYREEETSEIGEEEKPVIVEEEIPATGEEDIEEYEATFYDVKDPSQIAWLLSSATGQEKMTNGNFLGGNPFYNDEYNCEEQANAEEQSLSKSESFYENKKVIEEGMNKLKDPNLTEDEAIEIIDEIVSSSSNIHSMYEDLENLVNTSKEEFIDATNVHKDDRSDREISIVNDVYDEYQKAIGLSNSNIDLLEKLREGLENKTINITDVNKQADCDTVITFEECTDLVELQSKEGIEYVAKHAPKEFEKAIESKEFNENRGRE